MKKKIRKATVELRIRVDLELQEGMTLDVAVNEMDYDFSCPEGEGAEVTGTEMIDWNLIEGKC
ncbi:MAG TPA: hypothetical protein PLW78_07705 [bacterium]|nr:hypothetical protein [bacterium]HRQ70171.1 hypothetical protein [bacterium]